MGAWWPLCGLMAAAVAAAAVDEANTEPLSLPEALKAQVDAEVEDHKSKFDPVFFQKALESQLQRDAAEHKVAIGQEPEVPNSLLIDDGGKWKNFFDVGDEVLLLPEVMSKLEIKSRDHAARGDAAAEAALRQVSHWGRFYAEGWPQPMQYLRGHFGAELPALEAAQQVPVYLAEPYDACEPLTNADALRAHDDTPVIVVAGRGTCTFGRKANNTAASMGSKHMNMLLIVNDEPGVIHPPGPDAHDVEIFVAMLPQLDGEQWVAQLRSRAPGSARGTFVAMNCAETSKTRADLNQLCDVVTSKDADLVKRQVDGGSLTLASTSTPSYEFLFAKFGVDWGLTPLKGRVHVARDPPFGCAELRGVTPGDMVLVRRGGNCGFLDKAKVAEAAFASALLIANAGDDDVLLRPGVNLRWEGLQINIPVVLVSSAAADAIEAHSNDPGQKLDVTLTAAAAGHARAWEQLEPFAAVDGWPRSDEYRRTKYEALAKTLDLAEWPDRKTWLETMYARADKAAKARKDRGKDL